MGVQRSDGKFFILIDGKEATLFYRKVGDLMDIYDTFTPPELRGCGIAEQLALEAFRHAKKRNLKVIPSCPYISETFLKKHLELEELTDKS